MIYLFRENRFFRWVPVIIFYFLITYLSSLKQGPFQVHFFKHFDKILHFIEFGFLGLLVGRALMWEYFEHPFQKKWWYVAILGVGLLAFVDEVHQYFVPNRQMDFFDWIADLSGALVGILIYRFFWNIRFKKKE